jgi:hypothetical protein
MVFASEGICSSPSEFQNMQILLQNMQNLIFWGVGACIFADFLLYLQSDA